MIEGLEGIPLPAELRLGVVLDGDLKWEEELIEIEGKAYIAYLSFAIIQTSGTFEFSV